MSNELVAVLGRIADALTDRNRIEQERLDKQFPKPKNVRPAEITIAGDDKKEHFDDKPSGDFIKETEAALPQSRFRDRLKKGT